MGRAAVLVALAACGPPPKPRPSGAHAQLSLAADARMVTVPAGQYISGSTPEERLAAYDDFFTTAGNDTAREHKWFDNEEDRHVARLPTFRIDLMPVTQVEYAEFVNAGRVPRPSIDEGAWKAQGFKQDYQTEVTRYVWQDVHPPHGREDHPVVLVTHTEAESYCAWRGELAGAKRRLPSAEEYEKASRGEAGFAYPWGQTYEADKLNSRVQGPGDTTPAGAYSNGASPFGVLDLAGNVFQWTATPAPSGDKMLVKGSAWEDWAGLGRGASSHGRHRGARHVIVGFRCAADVAEPQ
ncbi:MAG: SUMF1/EgtB/PvdO family nonheme iron enzyme [Deltaproteobacteria bacterium]|nr:SUMF1/EgtB/PvdO family nonheme iron enzyme [Deltaproteobacteria bacterium]